MPARTRTILSLVQTQVGRTALAMDLAVEAAGVINLSAEFTSALGDFAEQIDQSRDVRPK